MVMSDEPMNDTHDSNDLDDLYQDLILEHTKKPRNFRDMPDASRHADGHNRLCGDKLRLYVKLNHGVITDVSFKGAGCSISTASASMMTDAIRGKTIAEAQALFEKFHHLLTDASPPADAEESLGKLAAFTGVRKFPVRVKCATLAWHTLNSALAAAGATQTEPSPVSTE
jgi:nitrogen fixation NifU-like protein